MLTHNPRTRAGPHALVKLYKGKTTMVRKALLAAMLLSLPAFGADFGGGYVGAYAGSSSGDDTFNSDETSTQTVVDVSGSAYGFIIGYNHQDGNFVIGTEFELGLGSADGDLDEAAASNNFGYDMSTEATIDYRWRARFGYAMENFMPFVAGGVASATTAMAAGCAACVPVSEGYDVHRIGFGIGVGLDWQMNDKWAFRAEYITEDFGSAIFNSYNVVGDTWDMNLSLDTFRIAASMQF